MAKALLMVENGFEDAEAVYPYYRLQEAGYAVDIVGPVKGKVYNGKYGYPLTAGLAPADVDLADYETVIIPGGQAPDRMRIDDGMVEIVKAAHERKLVIGAICHGPQMLIEADIVRGLNVTCYKSILTDILNAGAIYHDLPAVIDAGIVTARTPADLPEFCQQILALLKK
jgi:protease I